jgi:xanthine dehydrogenase accessory factor
MMEWMAALSKLTEENTPCVLVTVTEAKGSTPREAGTKMVVTADGQFGTIGGGNLEFEAVGEARQLLVSAATDAKMKKYPLGPALSQCCGGAVTVLLEPFVSAQKTVLLFGAGHVGKEVVRVLEGLPVRVKWVDERASEFPAESPRNCTKIVTTRPLSKLAEAADDAYIVVMTHSHPLDFEIVKAALDHGRFAYLGLIGSDTKAARFRKRLAAHRNLPRLTCPIGIDGIDGKHPREIAVSVVAELLKLGLTRVREGEDVYQDRRAAG